MKNRKTYEPDDSMLLLIQDNSNVLQALGSFGINLGFGDKTVKEVCEEQGVDTLTFLTVVNFTINGHLEQDDLGRLSVQTLMKYLKASHSFFIDFQLPRIRQELAEALDIGDSLALLILRLYDAYAQYISKHMALEEKRVFPYVSSLLEGETGDGGDIDTYSRHHGLIDQKLRELKNIIIKYLPGDVLSNNQLSAALYDIYNNEVWLHQHAKVEDEIFTPAIRLIEQRSKRKGHPHTIATVVGDSAEGKEQLSERERDVVVAMVQGMTNKEIADHLCISVNTVITHRRNIARKLQIHSPAGLTIYAIVNHLVDISSVKV